MATYRSIVGHKINKLSSDPAEPLTGQMWYNSTTGTLRALGIVEAWSSASNLNASVREQTGFGSTQNAQASAGGFPNLTQTEEYNGSGWSIGGTMSSGRGVGAPAGTQTSGLVAGGEGPSSGVNSTEEYNGTSWTSGGNLPATVRFNTGFGTQTAAVSLGGMQAPSPGARLATANKYDGSSWTATGSLNTARRGAATGGSQTSGIAMGGDTPPYSNVTEEFNGNTFSNGGNLNTTRAFAGGSGATQDAALTFGGVTPSPGPTNATESYNGSSWTTSPATLSVSRYGGHVGITAPNTSTIYYGGQPPATASTEEYNKSTNTVTAAAWSSGGNLNTARSYNMPAMQSPQTAGLIAGGESPRKTNVEEYNGSAWSEQNDIPAATNAGAGAGTQTSGIVFGGYTGTASNSSFEYDGSNWTSGGNLNTARQGMAGFGTQGACISAGGDDVTGSPRYVSVCESYNGTSWANTTSLPGVRQLGLGNAGTSTAGLVFGGYDGSTRLNTTTEWDGSAWTNTPATISAATNAHAGSGTQTAALLYGGFLPPQTNVCQGYDGTNWSTRPSMATARYGLGGSGPSELALAIGGSTGSDSSATEEFTGTTETANIANFTTS